MPILLEQQEHLLLVIKFTVEQRVLSKNTHHLSTENISTSVLFDSVIPTPYQTDSLPDTPHEVDSIPTLPYCTT